MENLSGIIEYIEINIKNPIQLEDIAKWSGWSKYYLHRIFKKATQMSLMEYVRGRKLSESLFELLNTQHHIIAIASEYGFAYEQSYTRAFKSFFNVTPSQYRLNPVELNTISRYNCLCHGQFGNGLMFPPQFITKPEIKLIGKKVLIYHQENFENDTANAFGRKTYQLLIDEMKQVKDKHYYGYVEYTNQRFLCNYYMPSVHVSSFSCDKVNHWDHQIIDATQYVKFTYVGFHDAYEINYKKLMDIYDFIQKEWIDKMHYQSKGFHFERIDSKFFDKDYCEMELFYPL